MKGAILIRDLAIGHCQIIGFCLNRICIVCLILMVTNILHKIFVHKYHSHSKINKCTSAENAT